jgi:hypothetical protein
MKSPSKNAILEPFSHLQNHCLPQLYVVHSQTYRLPIIQCTPNHCLLLTLCSLLLNMPSPNHTFRSKPKSPTWCSLHRTCSLQTVQSTPNYVYILHQTCSLWAIQSTLDHNLLPNIHAMCKLWSPLPIIDSSQLYIVSLQSMRSPNLKSSSDPNLLPITL